MFMTTTARIALTVITLIGMCAPTAVAQQATTRIEGKVTDPVTNAPVGCTINIVGPSGKKTKITSNSSDGTYLAVLNDAGDHKFSMVGFNVYRAEFTVNIPQSTRFQEIKRDFQVRGLVQGELIAQVRGFSQNQATIAPAGVAEIGKLKDVLSKNQQMNVVIEVYPDEDQLAMAMYTTGEQYKADSVAWAKAYKAWEKKYKKKKEKPEPPVQPLMPPPPADPNGSLLQQRKAAVAALFNDVKNGDLRISVVTQALPASAAYKPPVAQPVVTSKKSKKGSAKPTAPQIQHTTHNTMIIKVGQVKRLFD